MKDEGAIVSQIGCVWLPPLIGVSLALFLPKVAMVMIRGTGDVVVAGGYLADALCGGMVHARSSSLS